MRICDATVNTFRGLTCGIRTERAFRQEVVLFVIALPLGAVIAPGIGWYVAMIGALLATLATELLNTAIEKLADRITLEHDVGIGIAKDFGSAAVFCVLCLTGLIWVSAVVIRFVWI